MTLRTNSYARAAVHIFVTLVIVLSAWLLPNSMLFWMLFSLAGIFFVFEKTRLEFKNINSLFFYLLKPVLRPKEWWDATGAAYVSWGAMAAIFCFSKELAITALSYLAVGDAASSIAGSFLSTRRKSSGRYIRSAACLLSCVSAGIALYFLGLNLSLFTLLIGAVSATIFEAVPLHLNDNIRIPVGAGLIMSFILWVC